jgi:hypothetical protein
LNTEILYVLLTLVIISIFVEVGFLYYLYETSDKVTCNGIFCEFTKTIKNETMSRNCFENGVEINCSDLND